VAHSLSGCSINDVLQFNGSFYSEAVYPLSTTKEIFRYMKILKWNSYENSKMKFIWSIRNSNNKSLKNVGRAYQNYFANNLFKSFGFLKHCLLFGQWWFFRTWGPGSSKTFELHYLAVVRQVHSCSYVLIIFKSTNSVAFHTTCIKVLRSNKLVDDGTTNWLYDRSILWLRFYYTRNV
jgi:hypothetical protein